MAELFVDLSTNFDQGTDFTHVESYAFKTDDPSVNYMSLQPIGEPFHTVDFGGVPGAIGVANWEMPEGQYRMMVRILDAQGRIVHSHIMSLNMPDRRYSFTITMARP